VVPGRLELGLRSSFFYGRVSHQADCPDLGPECNGATPPASIRHEVGVALFDTTLEVGIGITDWLAAEMRWGLGVVGVDAEFTTLDGAPLDRPDDVHHRDEVLVGPRDPWLLLRLAGRSGGLSATTRLGATLPVGATEPDPYEAGRRGEKHQHMQLGTGTVVPVVGAGLAYDFDPARLVLGTSGLLLASFYENAEGYRAPARAFASVRGAVPLGAERNVRPMLELTLSHESAEVWNGALGMEGGARTELFAGAGIGWRFAGRWHTDATVRVLLARLTDAPGYETPVVGEIGVGTAFDLAGGDAEPE
jgi:hypothetical protein